MTDYKKKIEELMKEQAKVDEKHKQEMAALEERNDSIQRSKREDLYNLKEQSEREEQRRAERDQALDEVQTKMLEQQNNNLQKTQTDYASQLTFLQQSSNAEKASEKERQMKERTILVNNAAAQKLEAEKTKSTLNVLSEKRVADEKKLVTEIKEKMAIEKKQMVDTSLENQKAQQQEIRQLKLEESEIILKTNQLTTDFQTRQAIMEQAQQNGIAMLVEAHRNDEITGSQKDNLRKVRETCSSIKKHITALFNSFHVSIKMKSPTGLKKAAIHAQLTIENITGDINSLKRYLQNLQQDEIRKEAAQQSTVYLTEIESKLSAFNNYVENRKDLNSDSYADLMDCLMEMKDLATKLEEIIEKIPDIVKDSNFIQMSIRQTEMITGFSNPHNAIESSSARIREIENSQPLDEEGVSEE